jgi:ubiquinone/menaquinone biosynthesis C-methylase UbiE
MQADDYTDLYDLEENLWWFVGMREITAVLLDPFFSGNGGRMLLDAGCGTGGMLTWLTRYAHRRVVGIDLSPEALNFCRERGLKNVARASVTDLPFPDSAFDLVTSFDVLGQLGGVDTEVLAMREMYRVLRPGGVAFVRVAAYEWLRSGHDEALGTQRRYFLSDVVEKMGQTGFQVRRATYANSFLLPVAIFRRLILKRIGLAHEGSDVKPLPPRLRWLNRVLTRVLTSEAILLKHVNMKLMAGVSAICVAEKPSQAPRSKLNIASVTDKTSSFLS